MNYKSRLCKPNFSLSLFGEGDSAAWLRLRDGKVNRPYITLLNMTHDITWAFSPPGLPAFVILLQDELDCLYVTLPAAIVEQALNSNDQVLVGRQRASASTFNFRLYSKSRREG